MKITDRIILLNHKKKNTTRSDGGEQSDSQTSIKIQAFTKNQFNMKN